MNVRRPEWLEHPSNPRDAYSRLNQWATELGPRCSPRSLVTTFAERTRVSTRGGTAQGSKSASCMVSLRCFSSNMRIMRDKLAGSRFDQPAEIRPFFHNTAAATLCLVKTPSTAEIVAIPATAGYRRRHVHDHHDFRRHAA